MSTAVQVGRIAPSPLTSATGVSQAQISTDFKLEKQKNRFTSNLVMSQNKPSVSVEAFKTSFETGKKVYNHLAASCSISFFKRDSISSRFSARSDIGSVRRGSEASRRTNGRPEMYTTSKTTSEAWPV